MAYHNRVSAKVLKGGLSRFIHKATVKYNSDKTPQINNISETMRSFDVFENNNINKPAIHKPDVRKTKKG